MTGRGGTGGGYGAYEDDDYPVVGLDLLTPAEYEADQRRLAAYREADAQRASAAASTSFLSAGGVGEDPDRLTAPLPPYGGGAPAPVLAAQPAQPVQAVTGGFDYGDPGGAPPTAEDAAMLNAAWQQYDQVQAQRGNAPAAGASGVDPGAAHPAAAGARPAATAAQVARARGHYQAVTQPLVDQFAYDEAGQVVGMAAAEPAGADVPGAAEASGLGEQSEQSERWHAGGGFWSTDAGVPGEDLDRLTAPLPPLRQNQPPAGAGSVAAQARARFEALTRPFVEGWRETAAPAAGHGPAGAPPSLGALWGDTSIGASDAWAGLGEAPGVAAGTGPTRQPSIPQAPEPQEVKAPWEQTGEEADPEWLRRAVHAGEPDDPLSGYQRAASRLWEPVARGAARADASLAAGDWGGAALGAGEAALGLAGVPFSAPGALAAELLEDGGMAEEGAELLGAAANFATPWSGVSTLADLSRMGRPGRMAIPALGTGTALWAGRDAYDRTKAAGRSDHDAWLLSATAAGLLRRRMPRTLGQTAHPATPYAQVGLEHKY